MTSSGEIGECNQLNTARVTFPYCTVATKKSEKCKRPSLQPVFGLKPGFGRNLLMQHGGRGPPPTVDII